MWTSGGPYNTPLERTAAAVYFTCGRASRVRRRGRSTALRYAAQTSANRFAADPSLRLILRCPGVELRRAGGDERRLVDVVRLPCPCNLLCRPICPVVLESRRRSPWISG